MNHKAANSTTLRPEPFWLRAFRIYFLFVFVVGSCFQGFSPTRAVQAAGEPAMQTYYLSMPEEQVRTAFLAIDTGNGDIGNTMVSITSIATTVNRTIIYYDQWEDGYEALSTTPAQASTLVFGDGNTANGNACSYAQPASLCSGDLLTSGAVIALRNNVPSNPRGTSTYFDARDKLATTQVVAVTRAMWDSDTGTVLAGALQVYDTTGYGSDFRLPAGENIDASAMFDYAGLFIMAASDGTTVSIDSDGNGTTNYTPNLAAGQAYFLSSTASGVTLNSNAHITSNLPIQVNLITGDINSNQKYENRWFNIPSLAQLGSSYVTPVSSMSNSNSNVFLFNPNGSAITVYAQTSSGTTNFSVVAGATYRYVMPTGSGARFYTSGSPAPTFLAIGTNCSPATNDNGSSEGSTWDWGYTLIAEDLLAPSLAVGWAPGSNLVPPASNGSPVWVSANAATTIYVDYDGNPATGANTDINGNRYDTSYSVTALQSIRIADPDFDNTAMRVYTVNGTLLAAAWGEDSSVAGTANPYLDMGYVVFPLPQMVLTKDGVLDVTASLPGDAANVGDVIHYSLKVTNNGTRTLTNVTLVDPKLGTLSCTPAQPAMLAAGAFMTCTGNYTITQTDIDNGVVYNTATADSNQTPPVLAQEEVKIPMLAVTKTAAPTSVPESGANVVFTFVVKNNNTIASGVQLQILSLSDSDFSPLSGDADCQVNTVLDPQESCEFSITRWIQGDAELGPDHVNLFTAVAEDADTGNDPDVSASNDATVSFTDIDPAIDVEKYISVDGGTTWQDVDSVTGPLVFSGTTPRFRFVVTNTGPVALANVDVVDSIFGNIALDGTLAVGASATYAITGTWAAGQHTNIATVSGQFTDGSSNAETATDTDAANYFGAVPGLSLTKSAAPGTYDGVGQTITYSYVITNTGNYALNGPFSVTDNKASVACTQPGDGVLSPLETMNCTASYSVTQADLDASFVTNTATATGGGLTSNQATATVYAVSHPGLLLDKIVTSAGPYDSVGDVISYQYLLTNTGNVALFPQYAVVDNKITTVTCPQIPNPLPVGGSITCAATYTITQVDLNSGKVLNRATATAQHGGNPVTSNPDEVEVTLTQSPALSMDKTTTTPNYDAPGDSISYSYLVTNSGNVTLLDAIIVTDNKTLVTCPPLAVGGLVPGTSITCTATYTTTQADVDAGEVINVASAASGTVTSPTDSVTVPAVWNPLLTLVKTASPSTYNAAGQTISYSYGLTNDGNVTLSGPFTVLDDKATVTCDPDVTSLVPGDTVTCSASHSVTQAEVDAGSITNTAQGHAVFDDDPVDSNQATATVTADRNPALTLVKTGDPAEYDSVGDVLSYTYELTNTGNVTLTAPFTVTDDRALNEHCPGTPTSLAPAAKIICTASYSVTQADIDLGYVTNIATGHGFFGPTPVNTDEDSFTATAIQQGGLGLTKNADPIVYDTVGQAITYTYTIQNTGNITLAGPFSVSDNRIGDPLGTPFECGSGPLAPLATTTCTAIYTITQADLDAAEVKNTATASDGVLISNEAFATIHPDKKPALGIDKTAAETGYATAGALIHYSYLVTNTGNVTLSGPFTVSDDKATDEYCPETASLAPGASITCTATYTILQSDLDAGALTNVASATNGTVTSPTDTVTIPATQDPKLALKKSANPTQYAVVGQVITYDYLLTNSGNVTLSAPFAVSDDKASVTCPPEVTNLTPGGTLNCTATYTITQVDLDSGSVTNIATATALFGAAPVTSNQDTATVGAVQEPKLTLDKTTTTANYDAAGDTISYGYLLTNSGNVTLTGPFSVTDDRTPVTCTQPADGALSPNETTNCTATYTVQQADMDAGSVKNIATAKGFFGAAAVISNEDSVSVPAEVLPALSLLKAADPQNYDGVGDVITYTYTLKNIGNVTLKGPFSVDDDKATVTCTNPLDGQLSPQEETTCSATYTIAQADLDAGAVTNLATGHAFTLGDTPVNSNNASATVNAIPLPALTIVKSATPLTYNAVGAVISYGFVVTNSGNVTLHDAIVVHDDKATDEACAALPVDGLAPGASIHCTASYTISQSDLDAGLVTNSAYATSGATQSTPDTETVTAQQNPALTIDKSVTETSYAAPNDVLHYTYLVTNSGNVTLTAPFSVHDDKAADESCPDAPASLAPGDSITCSASYTITQSDLDSGAVTNHAYATVAYDGETVTSNTDQATVAADQSPALTLDKEGAFEMGPDGFAAPGELISYSFVVKNTGNITLHNVLVSDPLAGMSAITCGAYGNPILDLPVGVSRTCTASYPVTQADIDRGYVDNTATADADETGPVTDNNHEELPQLPKLALDKTVTSVGPYDSVDDVIEYQIVATNTGLMTLTNVTIADPLLGALSCTPEQPTTLAPAAFITCTGSYSVQQSDLNGGSVTNVASADADQTDPVTDTITVPLAQSPALALEKTVTSSGPYDSVGDVIAYQLVASNTGNITLHAVSIVDPKLGALTCTPAQPATLAPLEKLTCTGSHTLTQIDLDAGSYYNIATADSDETAPATDDVTVPMAQNGALTLDKSGVFAAGAGGFADPGELINYAFVVTNTGNLTLHHVVVTDPLAGLSAITCPKTTLEVGESMTCTATYAVTQANIDAGSVYNRATADSDESGPDTGENTEPLPQNPALTVEKSSITTSLSAPATVAYDYKVTNTGNVTLTGIVLADNNDNDDLACPYNTLAVGASMTCTATHTFTQVELDAGGTLDNLVTADSNQTAPVTDNLSIPITQSAAMTVEKSSTTTSLSAPATVPYSYLVTNTGNLTLTGITLSDNNDNNDLSCPATTLEVGAFMTCTATHTFTQTELDAGGTVDNIVTADSNQTTPVTDDLSIPIIQSAAMTVEKSSTTTSLSAPATVPYSYLVTNTGNLTLTGITLSDNNDNNDLSCSATTLAIGASMTCTATHTFTQPELDAGGSLDNIVTADSNETEPVTDDLSIPINQSVGINLVKTGAFAPGVDGFANVGELISYQFVVSNTGNTTLTGIIVSDSKVASITCPETLLAVSTSMTCTGTYAVTQTDIDAGSVYNLATADAVETSPVTDDHTQPLPQNPAIQIVKGPEMQKVAEGGTVTFDISVTNTGNVNLTNVDVVDALAPNCNRSDLSLAVGAVYTYQCTAVANADFTNVAAVTGSGPQGQPVSDTDDAGVDVLPTISVTKLPQPATLNEPGANVTFTVSVENTSPEEVTLTSLVDSIYGDLNSQGNCVLPQTIAAGETYTCAFTQLVSGDAGSSHTNIVTGTANDNESNPAEDTGTATVKVNDVKPAVTLVKSVTPATLPEPGGVFTYTLEITNTSVEPVTITALTDDNPLPAACTDLIGAVLAVNATVSCQYTVTQTNAGAYPNTAAVSVVDNEHNGAQASDNASVSVTDTAPGITVTKTASPTHVPETGGDVTFTFVVANTSVEEITLNSLTDSVFGDLDGKGTCDLPKSIAIGESYTCSITQFLSSDSLTAHTNVVTASAVDNDGTPATDTDDETVTFDDVAPAIRVTKTADPANNVPETGADITFTFLVENIGPEDVNLTSLTDSVFGNLNGQGSCVVPQIILIGQSYTCTVTRFLASDSLAAHTNIATAIAVDDDGTTATDDDAETVTFADVTPAVAVTKTASPTHVPETGGNVAFTFVVTNPGPEDLTLTSLVDSKFGDLNTQGTCAVPQTILIGQSYTCTVTKFLASDSLTAHTNEVTATAIDDESSTVTAKDDASVTFDNVPPAIRVTKTADPTTLPETGGDVTFTFLVENIGPEDVTLTGLMDDAFGDLDGKGSCDVPQPILIGGAYSCTFSTFLAADDLEAHTNVVTASALDDDGTPATDDDDATVSFTNVDATIAVTKTANPTSVLETGGLVQFTFRVTNTSPEAVEITGLSDSVYGVLAGDLDCQVGTELAVGGWCEFSISRWVEGDFGAPDHLNVFTTTAVDNDGTTATASDSASVAYTNVPPEIVVSKTANPTEIAETGADVTFTFVVQNTGPEAVTLNSLTDSVFGDLDGKGSCILPQTIAVDGSYTCAYTAFLTSDSLADHTNVVTAAAVDDDDTPVTANDDAIVTFSDVAPAITVTKTASPTHVPETGGDVVFTFVVNNTGPEAVTLNSLTDTVFGNLNGKGTCVLPQNIAISGNYTCAYTVALAADDLAAHTNVATASAVDDDGTPASATDDETVSFDDVAPAIIVTKTANPTHVPETGGDVVFTFVVNNTGPEAVTLTELTDSVFGNLDGKGTCDLSQNIAIGGNYTCTYTVALAADDLKAHTNVVTANAVDDDGTPASDTDDETVTFDDVAPQIQITKTANPTHVPETGGAVTFTFLVENTGPEDMTLTELTDSVFGNLDGKGTCDVPQSIAIGESYTCTYTVVLAADDLVAHTNVVTASAVDDDGTADTDEESETVTFEDVKPAVAVTKTADPVQLPETGGNVTFTFVVTNPGPEDLTLTSLVDSKFGNLNAQGTCAVPQTILIGGSYTCTVTKFLSSDSLTAHINEVTAAAMDDESSTVTAKDDATVGFTDVAPAITVTKTADPATLPETGGDVTFTFVVNNTGPEDVTLNSLIDDVFGNLDGKGTCDLPQTILIGGGYTCAYTVTLAADDLVAHTNVVTASAVDDDGATATDDESETVTFEDVAATVAVTKTANPTSVPETGGLVQFIFRVTNTSPEAVEITSLSDSVYGVLEGDLDCAVGTDLPAGGFCEFSISRWVEGDFGAPDHVNKFTAVVVDNDGTSATDDDDAAVTYTDVAPQITVTKTANPISIPETGADVTFTFVVQNTGPEAVTLNSLTDSVFGDLDGKGTCDLPQSIAVDGAYSCTYTILLASDSLTAHTNSVTAAAVDDDNTPATDTDDETVTFDDVAPAITVTKTADPTSLPETGGDVTFTFVVNNTGPEDVTLNSLTDTVFGNLNGKGSCAVPQSIAIGGSYTCAYTVALAADDLVSHVNVATASAVDDDGTPATDTDDETVSFTDVAPAITVTKTANPTHVPETGGNVTFTFKVQNTGPEAVILNELTDSVFGNLDGKGTCDLPQPIAIGGNYTCTYTVALAADDLKAHTNVVTANAVDDDGTPASDTDDETVTFDDVAPAITVTKTADPASLPETGGNVTFTILVENTGPEAVTLNSLTDTVFGNLNGQGTCVLPQTIGIGGSYSCAVTAFLSSDSLAAHTNIATATAVDDDGTSATDDDDANVTFTDVAPAITVTKTANPTHVPETGGDVTFTFLVENTGPEDVTLIELTDSVFGSLDGKGTCEVPQTILIGGSYTCAYTIMLASDSLTDHVNVVTARAVDDDQTPAVDTDDETVTFDDVAPAIAFTKSASPTHVPETGADVTFTFLVENIGAEEVTLNSLTDTVFGNLNGQGNCVLPQTIAIGGSYGCSITTFLASDNLVSHYNVATASVTDDEDTPATDDDDETVIFDESLPTVDLIKSVDSNGSFNIGDTATFTLTIQNTALEPVTITALTDTNPLPAGCTALIGTTLLPGASVSCSYPVTITTAGTYTNTAAVSVTDNEGDTATDEDSETIHYYAPQLSKTANGTYDEIHEWQVTKSVDKDYQIAVFGQKVDFTWTVNVEETLHGENYNVAGMITIANPNPDDPMTVALTDTLDDGTVPAIGPCTGGSIVGNVVTIPAGVTVTCAYNATPRGNGLSFNNALPDQVTMSVTTGYSGGPAFFPTTTVTNGGALNGTYEGWCADIDRPIAAGTNYQANVYSSFESLPAGLVENAQNLDLVNWIINQDYVGKSAGAGDVLGDFTYGDVQRAIWELIEDNGTASTSGLGAWNQTRVNLIKTAALANGEGFTPTCGDYVAVILQPLGGKQLVTIAQVSFASLGVDCAETNAVTAVFNGFAFAASADIVWVPNQINPTATLDDDQAPGWPVTVTDDATFTYLDPQGYTCSTDRFDYPGGYYKYLETNTAVLQYATGSDTASAATTVKCYSPVLDVTKTAKKLTVPESGGSVTYTYLVNNPGISVLTINSLVDDKFGPLAGDNDCHVGTQLANGASCSFDATFTLPAGLPSTYHTNIFTAVASDILGNPATDSASAKVKYLEVLPDISVVKTANKTSVPETGDYVTFTFKVQNTGFESVTITALSDSVFGALAGDDDCKVGTVLPVGGSCEFSITEFIYGDATTLSSNTTLRSVAAARPGFETNCDPVYKYHYNVFTAKAADVSGNVDSATDDEKILLTDGLPQLTVTKTANPTSVAEPGGNVTFTYTLKNTGTESIKITALKDSAFGTLTGDSDCKVGTWLVAGASCDFKLTKKISGNAGFVHTNIFTAGVVDNENNAVSATDDATVTISDALPAISVTKSASKTSVLFTGEKVTFTVKVKNTSIEALTLTALTDDMFGNLNGQGSCAVPKTLAVGATYTCSFSRTISAALTAYQTAYHTNTVTAQAKDDEGNTASGSGKVTIKFTWRGRTPGYWKNHASGWPYAFSVTNYAGAKVTIKTTTPVLSVFNVPASLQKCSGSTCILDLNGDGKNDTLIQALAYQGGSTLAGKAQILLRAAVAGLLNEQYFGVGYPAYDSPAALLAGVNATLASSTAQAYVDMAGVLDWWNNGVE